jgi:hypothetical protein
MNFAKFGIDCFGLALLLLPVVMIAFLPFLIIWSAIRDTDRMWRNVGRGLKL